MFKIGLLVILLNGTQNDYDATQRYNDSLLIYNTYHAQIEGLKKLKETDLQKWYQMDATNDRVTTCAKLRLKKYNKQSYEPIATYERKGMGMAYAYPKPGAESYTAPDAFAKSADPKYHFVVYDLQTHFLKDKVKKISIPYVLKMIFDQGRLLFSYKLNPVTLEKLESEISLVPDLITER